MLIFQLFSAFYPNTGLRMLRHNGNFYKARRKQYKFNECEFLFFSFINLEAPKFLFFIHEFKVEKKEHSPTIKLLTISCNIVLYINTICASERTNGMCCSKFLLGISIFSDFLVNSKQHNKQSSQQQTIIELRDNPLRYREED